MVKFKQAKTTELRPELTFENMRMYYEKYGVEWGREQIADMVRELLNLAIIVEDITVGIMRLSFEDGHCQLRDLQVDREYQGQGIGALALQEALRRAKDSHCDKIALKVFKISPAVHLYQRHGYRTVKEDDRFFYMECTISG